MRENRYLLLTAFSDGDPITRRAERVFQARVPGAKDQAHVTSEGAGHFLQEEKPLHVAGAIETALAAR